jgi:hypothetical protein
MCGGFCQQSAFPAHVCPRHFEAATGRPAPLVRLEDGGSRWAHAKYACVAARHLLTFELSEQGGELSIYGDAPGLRLLGERLLALAASAQTGGASTDQLSTSVWAGNELSLEPQGSSTRLVYQVRISAVRR